MTMTLNLEREFNAPQKALFEAIKDGVLFASCGFSRDSMKIDFKVGGKYWMQYQKDPTVAGEFLEIVPTEKVVFTWGEMNTKVTITIEPRGNSSFLKLTHDLIPDAYWQDRFKGGWISGFSNLEKTISK
jgi:uncharacterized protein YndB with AHSA1/START domain